jgi:hypothetical protein
MGGPLTLTQRAYSAIREELDQQLPHPADHASAQAPLSYGAGLRRALEILPEIDPDADPGEYVPGRVYGPETR